MHISLHKLNVTIQLQELHACQETLMYRVSVEQESHETSEQM